jgi:hypothetical protein
MQGVLERVTEASQLTIIFELCLIFIGLSSDVRRLSPNFVSWAHASIGQRGPEPGIHGVHREVVKAQCALNKCLSER